MSNINTVKKAAGSTRDFVPIKEVKDGIVILEDGTLVAIVLATSINLALKSYEEQQGILNAFQNFLNTLDFQVQISILSRKMDIGPYIEMLEGRLKEQENELIKLQTIEYISFIKNFSENVNVMEKQFFLVVSYKPLLETTKKLGIFGKLFSNSSNTSDEENSDIAFNSGRIQLEQRVATIESTLGRTGVKTKILDTEAVLEVFYSIYNPGTESDLIV
jgi:type IV secretory pathway VirB4 component